MADEPITPPVGDPPPVDPPPAIPPRPDTIPEQFWDAEKGAVKTEDLLAAYTKVTAPPVEPTAEEKAAQVQARVAEYGDFALPEGFTADPAAMGSAKELFANLGLDKTQAETMVKMHAEQAVALQKQFTEDGEKAWKDLHTQWEGEIAKDPEYGGAKLPETKAAISKVYDSFGTPELRDALKLVGADNNPHVFKFLAKVSKVLTEGKMLQGGSGTQDPPKTLAERLYPGGGNNYVGGKAPPTTET